MEPDAGWEQFSHTADIGVHGWGSTLSSAFEQAAKALTAIVTTGPISQSGSFEIECRAPDRELLLVEWLYVALKARVFGETLVCNDINRSSRSRVQPSRCLRSNRKTDAGIPRADNRQAVAWQSGIEPFAKYAPQLHSPVPHPTRPRRSRHT